MILQITYLPIFLVVSVTSIIQGFEEAKCKMQKVRRGEKKA